MGIECVILVLTNVMVDSSPVVLSVQRASLMIAFAGAQAEASEHVPDTGVHDRGPAQCHGGGAGV